MSMQKIVEYRSRREYDAGGLPLTLHLHAERVKTNAALWLPWNYQAQLADVAEPEAVLA